MGKITWKELDPSLKMAVAAGVIHFFLIMFQIAVFIGFMLYLAFS